MSGESLYTYLFDNFIVWVIAFFALVGALKANNEGQTGKAVMFVLAGAFGYWFGRDPIAVLGLVADVIDKLRGK